MFNRQQRWNYVLNPDTPILSEDMPLTTSYPLTDPTASLSQRERDMIEGWMNTPEPEPDFIARMQRAYDEFCEDRYYINSLYVEDDENDDTSLMQSAIDFYNLKVYPFIRDWNRILAD